MREKNKHVQSKRQREAVGEGHQIETQKDMHSDGERQKGERERERVGINAT